MRTIPSVLTWLAALAATAAVPQASAQSQTFTNPTLQNLPLSYCGATSASCGEAIAMAWCRAEGYETATSWAARSAGAGGQSIRLDDGGLCQGATCDSFAEITCGRPLQTFTMPVLGSASRMTVLSPNLRSTEIALDEAEFKVLIPGCFQLEPGIFMCETIHEYQHCRTLMVGRMVFSCRVGRAFESGYAEPYAAQPDEYELELDADIRVRLKLGDRGHGQVRGDADVWVKFDEPALAEDEHCLQRDRYVYFTTGPRGGISEVDNPDACSEPIEMSFEPHEDDLLRAYDLCDAFGAWGDTIDDSIDVLVAALYQIGSNRGSRIAAPFLTVKAPISIECRV
ncbi:MAG: hypothetical protein R3305_05380 [Gammaproteobacteria bacterium]|nr:hypothetical protein [Gammaproteobacteria bacterium]